MLAWWGSAVECASALARLERDTALDTNSAELAFQRLRLIADAWHEIEPSERVRENAVRFLRAHSLRAADALQLAAAFLASERRPATLQVVTPDERLAMRCDAMRCGRKGSRWSTLQQSDPAAPPPRGPTMLTDR
jgi:predicted nucleic acid-binding protein